MRNYSPTGRPHRSHHPGAAPAASFPATVTPDDPKPLRSSRPSGRPAPQPTGRPRGTTVGSGRGGYDPRFAGPILGGEVAIPTKRELRRAKRRRRSRGERLLRTLVFFVAFLLLMVSLGYGYFRYQWGQIASAPCATCVASANGAPYNVLLIGSDSRAGETAAQAEQFGTPTAAAGQRSDTIKIVHIDPQAGTASTLSIPRDTFVSITGLPSTSQLSTQNKINAAFSGGPDALVKTIENTFGIPISHYISISFFGVMDAVNALGGISLNFPYPGRDRDCHHPDCRLPGSERVASPQPVPFAVFPVLRRRLLALRSDLGPRPNPAPESCDFVGPEQGQVDLQPASTQLTVVLGGPRLHQGQRPVGWRPFRLGRTLPRLQRLGCRGRSGRRSGRHHYPVSGWPL
jgi:LCP family protein required for cell wall assembly